MSAEKAVTLGISEGDDCVVCDMPITIGVRIIEVNVAIRVVLKVNKRVEVHMGCAKDLRDLIDKRLKEAKK